MLIGFDGVVEIFGLFVCGFSVCLVNWIDWFM